MKERRTSGARAKDFFLNSRDYEWVPDRRGVNKRFFAEERALFRTLLRPRDFILDIPMGEGRLTEDLAKFGKCVVAGDISATQVRKAVRLSIPNLDCIVCDAEAMPFRHHTFDLIVVWDSLHYFSEPVAFMRDVMQTVKGDAGLVLFNVPLSGSVLTRAVKSLARRVYYLRILAPVRHRLNQVYGLPLGVEKERPGDLGEEFSIDEFRELAKACGMRIERLLLVPERRPKHLIAVASMAESRSASSTRPTGAPGAHLDPGQ